MKAITSIGAALALLLGTLFAFGKNGSELEQQGDQDLLAGYTLHSERVSSTQGDFVADCALWLQAGPEAQQQAGELLRFLTVEVHDANGQSVASVRGMAEVNAQGSAPHSSETFSVLSPEGTELLAEVLFTPIPGLTWAEVTESDTVRAQLVIYP